MTIIYIKISQPVIFSKKQGKQENKITFMKNEPLVAENRYFFPARILFMKIDFKQIRYVIVYKVMIRNFDKFALFNIKTILDEYNIPYSLYRGKKSEIYIFFKNLAEANSVLNLFKEYNFNIKIQKIKKRI